MKEWVELILTIGVPIGAVLWLLIRLHVKSEVQQVTHAASRELTTCSDKIRDELKSKADKATVDHSVERLFNIVDEMRNQMFEVVTKIRRERGDN